MHESNRDTIAARADVAVACLPRARDASPAELLRIGSDLPVADWLAGGTRSEP
jgi:hypothetical protein